MMTDRPLPEGEKRPEAPPSGPVLDEYAGPEVPPALPSEAETAGFASSSEAPPAPEASAPASGSEPLSPPFVPPPPSLFRPAGFIRRGVAFAIDLLLIYFLYLVLWIVGIVAMTGSVSQDAMLAEILSPPVFSLFVSVWFFLFVGYFTFFHACDGQTPGKIVVRIKVVTKGGEPLSSLRAFFRTLGYFLSGPLLWGFGFLITIFDRKSRALHDRIARSFVILS